MTKLTGTKKQSNTEEKIMKKIHKALIALFGALALTFAISAPLALHARDVSVTIDGVEVDFADQNAVIADDRTLVPVHGVFETLGFYVDWDADTLTATMSIYDITIVIVADEQTFTINGIEFEFDVPARLIGDRILVPIRAVLEAIGHFVYWDNDTSTVIIRNLWGFTHTSYDSGALANQIAPPEIGEQIAVIHTNHGEIHLRLFPDLAPLTVENFTTHALNGFFDGMIFHRVIDDFVIQGGDPTGTGAGGQSIWGQPFGDEFTTNLRHLRGALSMANAGPFTNSSQFFIVQSDTIRHGARLDLEDFLVAQDALIPDTDIYIRDVFPVSFINHYLQHGGVPDLDFHHAVFGQVFYGMDVVDTIAAVAVGSLNLPLEDVVIIRIEIRVFGE